MTDTELDQEIFSVFKEFSEKQKNLTLTLESSLDALQLDSLDTLDLLMQIDKQFSINVPVEQFALCNSLHDVKRLIQSISNA